MATMLVLGANSFAGASFIDSALSQGYDVWGVNRSSEQSPIFLPQKSNARAAAYTFRQLDLNHDLDSLFTLLREVAPAFVIDFAGQGMVAESWGRPEQWYQTNIVAKVRLHDFLRQQPWLRKYVRVSTPEVYGSTPSPAREDSPYAPSTPYAVSHAATDLSVLAFTRNYRFPAVLTRCANFFGPGQQLYRIVPRTIIYALAGRTLCLDGGGTSVRAFVHSRDVADGLLRVVERGNPGEIYHLSPVEFRRIRAVVETIHREMGVDHQQAIEIGPERPGKDQMYLMDASKARTELNWEPRIPFLEGIRQTISWVKANFGEIKTLPWDYEHKA